MKAFSYLRKKRAALKLKHTLPMRKHCGTGRGRTWLKDSISALMGESCATIYRGRTILKPVVASV